MRPLDHYEYMACVVRLLFEDAQLTFFFQGVYQLVRRFSDLLRNIAAVATFNNLVDRVDSGVSAVLRGHIHWASDRRGIFSPGLLARLSIPSSWDLRNLSMHSILAILPCTRHLHGAWQRLPFLPSFGDCVDLLQQEKGHSHWHHCLWQCHGRSHIPQHGPTASADGRISVDDPCHRLHPARRSGCCECAHEDQDTATEERSDRRVGGIQGAGIRLLCPGQLLRTSESVRAELPSREMAAYLASHNVHD